MVGPETAQNGRPQSRSGTLLLRGRVQYAPLRVAVARLSESAMLSRIVTLSFLIGLSGLTGCSLAFEADNYLECEDIDDCSGSGQYCGFTAANPTPTCVDADDCTSDADCETGFFCLEVGGSVGSVCVPYCGNGRVDEDQGETCDGADCPTSCDDADPCTVLQGSPQTCDAQCVAAATCISDDGTCCEGCTTLSDNDCGVVCGNGLIEAGEVCDDGYTDACGSCNADCSGIGTSSLCGDGERCEELEACDDGYEDACGSCNENCSAVGSGATCGDGETCPELELCDGSDCPTSCDDSNPCTSDVLDDSAGA